MLKRIFVIVFIAFVAVLCFPGWSARPSAQEDPAAYKSNSCVACHSGDARARGSFARYTEWHLSAHKEKGVGCEKCHGGDASDKDQKQAHAGVFKPSDPQSRLHPKSQPQTCGACHQGVTNSFVESAHYRKLSTAGLGPSCNTCHAHMGTSVLYTAEETASLCAHCHDTANGLLPRRPEIPAKANATMQAIRRADAVVTWADRLMTEGRAKKADLGAEERELKIVQAMLAEAKVSWHAFNLEVVQKKADAAFEAGTKLKDALRKKLFP